MVYQSHPKGETKGKKKENHHVHQNSKLHVTVVTSIITIKTIKKLNVFQQLKGEANHHSMNDQKQIKERESLIHRDQKHYTNRKDARFKKLLTVHSYHATFSTRQKLGENTSVAARPEERRVKKVSYERLCTFITAVVPRWHICQNPHLHTNQTESLMYVSYTSMTWTKRKRKGLLIH